MRVPFKTFWTHKIMKKQKRGGDREREKREKEREREREREIKE